jgi:hypothetical protein
MSLDKSQVQQEKLAQIRQELVKEGYFDEARHNDSYLTRFLISRNFEIKATLSKLIATENWRKKIDIDKIINDFAFTEHEEIHKIYPRYYHSVDKEGRSIYIEQLKNIDYTKLSLITTSKRLEMQNIRELERLVNHRFVACSKKFNKPIDKGTVIIDCKGAPFSQFGQLLHYLKMVAEISSDHYPETLGIMFVINAPFVFTALWNIIKKFIDPKTAGKTLILDSDYQATLLEYIDPEHLPVAFGGTCECAGGCDRSDKGPWKEHYIHPYSDYPNRDSSK